MPYSRGIALSGEARVLITQADTYMGPATATLFQREGAEIVADTSDLTVPGAAERLIAQSGHIDVLIANLATPSLRGIPVTELGDEDWLRTFERLVHPLHRLVRAVAPQMISRRVGKIVV